MNVAILATIGKWVSCLLIGFVSIFSGTIIKKELLETTNINEDKSYSALNETIPYETKKTEIRQSFPTFEMDDPIVPFLQSSNVDLNTPFQSTEKKKAESTVQAYDFSFDGFDEFDETVVSFFTDENKKRK